MPFFIRAGGKSLRPFLPNLLRPHLQQRHYQSQLSEVIGGWGERDAALPLAATVSICAEPPSTERDDKGEVHETLCTALR